MMHDTARTFHYIPIFYYKTRSLSENASQRISKLTQVNSH